MKRTLITLATAAIIGMGGAAMADMNAYCASEWPGDFRMQAHCVDRQKDGIRNSHAFVERHNLKEVKGEEAIRNNPYAMMWIKCTTDWELPRFNTHDWRMVNHCLERQMDGLRRLGK